MEKYIRSISGTIPHTTKEVNISLNGRNLIVTGANGSGKTSFLTEVFKKTSKLIISKRRADLAQLEARLIDQKRNLKNQTKGTRQYTHAENQLTATNHELDSIIYGLQVDMPNNIQFSAECDENEAVVGIYHASRAIQISVANTAKGLQTEMENAKHIGKSDFGQSLEQHLVNLKNRRSLALSEDNDVELADKIEQWFIHFESNLKVLMEDKSTCLEFNSDTLKFSISQEGKALYTFQDLSSGYLAIFDIYADLLMRTEYFKVTPERLKGTVFIDEIDAHLHVSLQRLILPFLTKSFPAVQFIVTSHSPFVLMSVDDTVVYDIGRNSQIEENLSFYSYSSVMEGILDTKTTSVLLEDAISKISTIVTSESVNYELLKSLVDKIMPLSDKLNDREKAFYLLGVNKLLDQESD
jgi:AAA15 family ATPase/GTPase